MIIGVPREVKADEHRVALLPSAACQLTQAGHTVLVQSGPAPAAVIRMPITPKPVQS